MDFPFGETVTVLTAGTKSDPYSDDTEPDWDNPTSATVSGVAVEPRPSQEPLQDARNATVSGFTLYMPAGTEIGSQNKVTVRGKTYDVLGDAADWRDPFTGWQPGLVVQVGLTEG